MSLREYVIEEKRFCEFKIKTLERVSSPSKLRLLKKERDFLSFDFESIGLSTIEECREAMNLFRISKSDFFRKYNSCVYSSCMEHRERFLQEKIKKLTVGGAGIIDGHRFRALESTEPYNSKKELRSKYVKYISICKDLLRLCLDFYKKNDVFPSTSTDALNFMPDSDIKYEALDNYIKILNSSNFESIIHKTEESSLIVTDMPHKSNEKINIIYYRFFDSSGNIVSPKKNKFVSIYAGGEYYKGILFDRSIVEDLSFSKSFIGVGSTRRFSEHLSEIKLWLRVVLIEVEEIS